MSSQVTLETKDIQIVSIGEMGPAGAQGPAGPAGPAGGSSGGTLTLQAGENLAVGDPVYVSANTFFKADNTTNFKSVGIVPTATLAGFSVMVTTSGAITLTGLTPNSFYFLGSGIITTVAPITGYVVRLGQAISSTTLLVNIEEGILLS